MKNKILCSMFFILFCSCSKISTVDPFILTQKLNPHFDEIKIFWTDDISEVTFNNKIIKTQGVYYLAPKEYNLTWKYKIIKDNETVYKWKSSKLDTLNTKEIYFEKEQVFKK